MLLYMNVMAQLDNTRQLDDSLYCRWKDKHLNVHYYPTCVPRTPGWKEYALLSDDFNDSIINTTKWEIKHNSWHKQNKHIGYLNSSDNVKIQDGKLILSVTENTDSLNFTCSWCGEGHAPLTILPELISGWITSTNTFRYGYIETKCRLPKNHNYWPCFWTTKREGDDYDEVDVFERTRGDQTNYPNIIRQNCYNGADCTYPSFLTQILTLDDSITGKEVVFGAEILPEEVVFYINGHVSSHLKFTENPNYYNRWNTFTCTDIEEMLPMKLILSLTCDSTQLTIPIPNESAQFDYVKCYKLDRDTINTYHPSVFLPTINSVKVYPHVILGGIGHTANVNTPTAIWAEQDIILDKGFELSSNTAFSARVIKVPNPDSSELYIRHCKY